MQKIKAQKNRSISSLVCLSLVAAIGVTSSLGCSGLKTRSYKGQLDRAETQAPGSEGGEVEGEGSEPFSDSQSEEKKPVVRPRVGLILGPGGARTLAHTAVIKQLEQARIPIDWVVGLEWGALVAAMYAQNGRVHEAEWKLFKMKKKDVIEKGLFSTKLEAKSVESLGGYFKKNFSVSKVDQFKVSFACPSLSIVSGTISWQKKVSPKNAMERCLPFPPLMGSKRPWSAAPFSVDRAISFLKAQGMELIILVDVLKAGSPLHRKELLADRPSAILLHEVRRTLGAVKDPSVEVIGVKARNYKIYDFEKRNELVNAGRAAGESAAGRIADKYGF